MQRIKLTNRQCRLFMQDMIDFGYKVTFEEIRAIADQVADGTHSETDVVARILVKQIDEATEQAKARKQ